MAIVYRVETSEGFGPYSPVAPDFPEVEEYHPNPLDSGIEGEHGWVFGFSDLAEIPLWFSGFEVGILQESANEWIVSKYEIDPLYLSVVPLQAAFDKSRAEFLGCISLEELADAPRVRFTADRVAELESIFEPRRELIPTPHFPTISELLTSDRDTVKPSVPQPKSKTSEETAASPKFIFSRGPIVVTRSLNRIVG